MSLSVRLILLVISAWLAAVAPAAMSADAKPVLRVLAWPGYADPDVVEAFEREYGARVEVTVITTDDSLWQRVSLLQASDFDVFAVNTAELQRYIDAQLVLPVDADAIPNTQRQLPRFRDHASIPGLMRDGLLYGIPYTYAEMGLIYDKAQFARPPDSIDILWDPRFARRILAYNGGVHNFTLAAQHLRRAHPFALGADDWPPMIDSLIALRRNVLAFYSQPEESVELFRRHQVAVLFANYGSQQLQLFKSRGIDVGYAIPSEGALAWLDCWVITHGVQNRTLATAWINFMLRPDVSGLLVTRQGLASTLEASAQDSGGALIWLQPVEDAGERERLWSRVLSGDRATKVLHP